MKKNVICPNCGATNNIENDFCSTCGAKLEDEIVSTKSESMQQTKRVYKKQSKLGTTTKPESEIVFKIFAILGLIFSIISITVFSWLGWFFLFVWDVYYWFPILFISISLLGIIFSALGIRGNIVIGIIGLILGIIGSLIQTVIVGITIYIWITA